MKNTLSLLNKIRNDALIRTADSPELLVNYVNKYYQHPLTLEEAKPLYKSISTINAKIKEKREAAKLITA